MKKILLLIFAGLVACSTVGCHTNIIDMDDAGGGGGGGDKDKPTLTIPDRSQLEQQIMAESQVCEVGFSANASWQVTFANEQAKQWVSVTPLFMDYGGAQTLRIFADENTSGMERTVQFSLRCGNQSVPITIVQSPHSADGTTPEPFNPDPYTDIVERITVLETLEDSAVARSFEWRFRFDPEQRYIYSMAYLRLVDDTEHVLEVYNRFDISVVEYATYEWDDAASGTVPRTRDNVELNLNDYGLVLSQWTSRLDYRQENGVQERFQTINSYTNYRRTAMHIGDATSRYDWKNGNLVRYSEQYAAPKAELRYTYTYNEELNNRTNIDLNALLLSDTYAAVGVLGKRSLNLLASRTYFKGQTETYEYTFDEQGRVETITCKSGSEGKTTYTIYYQNINE